ncbi:MAG: hypothetical protein JOZ78_18465 [Chroococcidiopsidaceae cyanobacterium CP_BM_ER_R8_30]|nr:hypothetical protein [Chroococcidiopsidaceae cyanobacterium CP_BM_ER_R8_30]
MYLITKFLTATVGAVLALAVTGIVPSQAATMNFTDNVGTLNMPDDAIGCTSSIPPECSYTQQLTYLKDLPGQAYISFSPAALSSDPPAGVSDPPGPTQYSTLTFPGVGVLTIPSNLISYTNNPMSGYRFSQELVYINNNVPAQATVFFQPKVSQPTLATVPEPSSMSGIFAFVGLGTGWTFINYYKCRRK